MSRDWRGVAARNALPLLALYAVIAAAAAHMLLSLPSATYRDEWGFAEFRIAKGLLAGVYPVAVPEVNSLAYGKVGDIRCSVGSQAAAALVARATGAPLSAVYAYGVWAVALAPLAAYALLRQAATPWWSAAGAAAATTFTVGFPYYLVDPKGLLLLTHALFVFAAWRVLQRPTPRRGLVAVAAALANGAIYVPFGVVSLAALAAVLVIARAPARTLGASGGLVAAVAVAVPACYMPYATRILTDLHLPQYPPEYVPQLHNHGVSVQLVTAGFFGLLLLVAVLGRSLRSRPQQLLLATSAAAAAFVLSPFSIHRFFNFTALPLVVALANAASTGARDASAVTVDGAGARRGVGALEAVPRLIERVESVLAPRRPGVSGAAWRAMLLAFLAVSLGSVASYPATPVAQGGTFSEDYMEGVRWVGDNVHDTYISDVKFVGAVYAHTENPHGYHILDNYNEEGELVGMWYSDSVDRTISIMRKHDARYLVLTSDMARMFVVGDFFRTGAPHKLEQVRESDAFRLVYENPEIEVYKLTEEENPWRSAARSNDGSVRRASA